MIKSLDKRKIMGINPRLSPLFIWYDDSDANLVVAAPAGTGVAPEVVITLGAVCAAIMYINRSESNIFYIDQSLSPAFYIDQARSVDMER